MRTFLFIICLGAMQDIKTCIGIKLIDVAKTKLEEMDSNKDYLVIESNESLLNKNAKDIRRYLFRADTNPRPDNDKDDEIKSKIAMLVEQSIHDTGGKIKSVEHLKETHRDEAPYKIGFILSMVKKSKEVLNELFNVAIKHKEDWKALEQLKVFELIVHTNVDTSNLVRQLVEIHMANLNTTNHDLNRKRLVIL